MYKVWKIEWKVEDQIMKFWGKFSGEELALWNGRSHINSLHSHLLIDNL